MAGVFLILILLGGDSRFQIWLCGRTGGWICPRKTRPWQKNRWRFPLENPIFWTGQRAPLACGQNHPSLHGSSLQPETVQKWRWKNLLDRPIVGGLSIGFRSHRTKRFWNKARMGKSDCFRNGVPRLPQRKTMDSITKSDEIMLPEIGVENGFEAFLGTKSMFVNTNRWFIFGRSG